MNQIRQILSAKKRSISMGAFSGWKPSYNDHPLAATMDNYTWLLDTAMIRPCSSDDYTEALYCIYKMAYKINAYCDNNQIKNDLAAQYWLERFLWCCDKVAFLDKLI